MSGRDAPPQARSRVGQRGAWGGNMVEVVAEIPGWVFVLPRPPAPPGRPFAVPMATWSPDGGGDAIAPAEIDGRTLLMRYMAKVVDRELVTLADTWSPTVTLTPEELAILDQLDREIRAAD